jgi:hypothetical protein
VSIGDWFGLGRTANMALNVPTAGVLSPWADDSFLERVVIPDIWPDATPRPMTRGEASAVPAVSRARHLICATVAKLPLVALKGADPVPDQPYWCYGTDGQLGDLTAEQRRTYHLTTEQSPFQRMLGTADDLLFYGWSLWRRTEKNLTTNPKLPPRIRVGYVRIPYGLWEPDEDRGVIVDQDGQPFAAGDVVLIEGPHDGVLRFGAATIRAAGTLEMTAAEVARTPFRIGLHQTTDITLSPAERAAIVAETRRALADNQGILFTNSALEVAEYRLDSSELLVGGRQAAALDVARHMNIPGAMIDAEPTGSSLAYSNPESRNQQWLDYGLSSYLDAISAALSMDSIVPSGTRVAFDTSSLTTTLAPTTGAPTPD